jgi:hypothetical protein
MKSIELLVCAEFRFLQAKFSSGVTIRELQSVAEICAFCAGILPPGREQKRSFEALVKWFIAAWSQIHPWLNLIDLRDEDGLVINGTREFMEKRAPNRTDLSA